MAADRFVYFTDVMPSREEVRMIFEDYLRGIATEVKETQKDFRMVAFLHGTESHPFQRINDMAKRRQEAYANEPRAIEVFFHYDEAQTGPHPAIDVITRQGDEVTSVLATGFAQLMARYFNGRLEMG